MNDTPVRILVVEDRAADAELMLRELERAGYAPQWERVETESGYLAALDGEWDVILADYALPNFSGIRALELWTEREADVPFIIVSGSIGDELAVELIKAGATDYVLKERLARLGPAVDRALRDMSDRRERQATEAALRFRSAALDAAANAVTILDRDGKIVYVNAAFAAWTGYAPDHAAGRHTRELTRPAQYDATFYVDIWARLLDGYVWKGEMPIRRSDGAVTPTEVTGTPIRNANGEVTHVIAMYDDISARKAAESALRASEARLELAVEAGNVGLWDWDLRTDTVYYSPVWKRQIGYEDTDVQNIYSEWETRIHPDDLPGVLAAVSAARDGTVPRYESSFRFRHKDGTYRQILARGVVLRDDVGRPVRVAGSHVDLTEMSSLQAQLLQAQKMDAVGQLAGGVAHDFNNMLGIILGYGDLILAGLHEEDPLRDDLKEMMAAGQRSKALTRQLLAFSRKQILRPEVLDLNSLVREFEKMLRRLIGEDIDLSLDLAPDIGPVLADPGQIEQVLLNLAVNARDAMPRGGRLLIETREEALAADLSTAHPRSKGERYVSLVVTDTGSGIDPAIIGVIFDPFVTTKEVGRGTGLGLSTVYGIVQQSGGHITVQSELGHGTTFRVWLPRTHATSESPSARAPGPVPQGAGEQILLVEDEEVLRRLGSIILSRLGYRVTVAAHGGEALLLMEQQGLRPDLVVTDLVMPILSGPELVARLQTSFPALKVLYMSGYVDGDVSAHRLLKGAAQFIQKPFSMADLARTVRLALSGSQS